MNQATNPVEESPELKSSVEQVTDILTRPGDKAEVSNQTESEQPPIEDVESGEEYIDEPSEEISEEYEEVLEDEEDSELYADEQTDIDEDEGLQQELIEVKIDGKLEQVSLDELRNGYSRQQHFTRQSQKLAEEKKQFEAEARQVQEERNQYAQLLGNLENQIVELGKEPEPDWNLMYEQDPIEASKKQHEWNAYKQQKAEKLNAVKAEQQRIAEQNHQANMMQYQTMLSEEAQRLPEVIPAWKDEKIATKEKAELKDFLLKKGVTEEEVSALVKANHVSVLRDAMLYNKGKRKVIKRANKTNGTKVLKSGSKKSPKKTDAYKKTTSRLKKGGQWQDAQSAISMLLND
tara:strand:- start:1090 stop:2133 length:1044 start_codon:yes stop_codon:yes gene_type:complete